MSDRQLGIEADTSRRITLEVLDEILDDFGISRSNGTSCIDLSGAIPQIQQTKSEHINMSLIGAVPSLANAVAATQIFEARGGQAQTIGVDLRRSHNYLDPNIGVTPTINGQVRTEQSLLAASVAEIAYRRSHSTWLLATHS